MGQDKASTAQPKIVSNERYRPSTSNFMRETHGMQRSNLQQTIINKTEDGNLGNQSCDSEHTYCCGKLYFINVTSRYNAEQKRFL